MPYAINTETNSWRAVSDEFTEAELAPGEQLVAELPDWFLEQVAAAEALQQVFIQLNSLIRQANAQVTALTGRINTLDYLISQQDLEDPDYLAPTDAEIAELPVRKAQLKSWINYNAKLGRMTTSAGWPANPVWPVMPEPYTSETSLVTTPTA